MNAISGAVFFTILIFGSFIPYQIMLYPIVILLREAGLDEGEIQALRAAGVV